VIKTTEVELRSGRVESPASDARRHSSEAMPLASPDTRAGSREPALRDPLAQGLPRHYPATVMQRM